MFTAATRRRLYLFSIFSIIMLFILLFCLSFLMLHKWLTRKRRDVDEIRNAMEPLLRQRMESILAILDRLDGLDPSCTPWSDTEKSAGAHLQDLCEAYRDAELEALWAANVRVTEALKLLTRLLSEGSGLRLDEPLRLLADKLTETEKELLNKGLAYNERLTPYHHAISTFPGVLAAGMFLLTPLPPFLP